MNNKQLDSYSILICSKYFESEQDFINIICVNSKFKETTKKLRFNPIPIKSLKLFPKIQTQYLYHEKDVKLQEIDNYEIWYKIDYDHYLEYRENNINCYYIVYTRKNRLKHGDEIPKEVNILGDTCFSSSDNFSNDSSDIKELTIFSKLISIGDGCFRYCESLLSIILPVTLTSLGNNCFYNCKYLKSINLPFTLKSIGDNCFNSCWSLRSIKIPSTLTYLGNYCFMNCYSLSSVDIPSTIQKIGDNCFKNCALLKPIDLSSPL
ncbi:Leucine rich repeat protein bspa family [Entamoeba marina]